MHYLIHNQIKFGGCSQPDSLCAICHFCPECDRFLRRKKIIRQKTLLQEVYKLLTVVCFVEFHCILVYSLLSTGDKLSPVQIPPLLTAVSAYSNIFLLFDNPYFLQGCRQHQQLRNTTFPHCHPIRYGPFLKQLDYFLLCHTLYALLLYDFHIILFIAVPHSKSMFPYSRPLCSGQL